MTRKNGIDITHQSILDALEREPMSVVELCQATGLADWAETLQGHGPDHDLRHMGPAQKLVLLSDLMDAMTQRLADQFGMDARNMALVVGDVQRRWVSSINNDVVLR